MCTAEAVPRAIMAGLGVDVGDSAGLLSSRDASTSHLMQKSTVDQGTKRADFDAGDGISGRVEAYAAGEFRAFREAIGMNNDEAIKEWDFGDLRGQLSTGSGKSGSLFRTSVNKKMLLKTIPRMEKNTLMSFLARYFQYILANPDSLIMRLLGLYNVTVRGSSCYVLVVSNLLANTGDQEVVVHDLKGRKPKPKKIHGDSHGKTVSDNTIGGRRFWLEGELAKGCCHQLVMDVGFLRDINIMDYSLLVAVVPIQDAPTEPLVTLGSRFANGVPSTEKHREKYFIGIIDCLTEYNWKKIGANLMKTTCCYRGEYLSTIPAQPYGERFISMVHRLFSDQMGREIRRASQKYQLEPEFERSDSTATEVFVDAPESFQAEDEKKGSDPLIEKESRASL